MMFLSKEADSEIQRKIVHEGFDQHQKTNVRSDTNDTRITPATAASLVHKEHKLCIFCKAANVTHSHKSVECRRSNRMSLEETEQILSKVGCCFKCLKRSHRKRTCVVPVECTECHETTHEMPMCPKTKQTQTKIEPRFKGSTEQKSSNIPVKEKTVNNTASNICRKDVLLKTVLVRVKGPKGSITAQLLFDEGSQSSHITPEAVKQIGALAVSSEWS